MNGMRRTFTSPLSRTVSFHEQFLSGISSAHSNGFFSTHNDDDTNAHSSLYQRNGGLGINGSILGQQHQLHRSLDEDRFTHIKDWFFSEYAVNPCSRTETIYVDSCRSEEPVQSNMDISTGHIVLVSTKTP